MSDYLEEAAAQLRKTQASLDAAAKEAAHEEAAGREATAAAMMRRVNDRRMQIAAAFTRLAAIERGLLPPEMAQDETPGGDS